MGNHRPAARLEGYTGRKAAPDPECRAQYFRSAKTLSRIDLINAISTLLVRAGVSGENDRGRGCGGGNTGMGTTIPLWGVGNGAGGIWSRFLETFHKRDRTSVAYSRFPLA